MALGIICGFLAALFNSVGYLFSARFILHYKSSFRLLITAQTLMLAISLPFLPWLFPFAAIDDYVKYVLTAVLWVIVFMLGQAAFFTGLRYFEASRLSSLLGLKIIVLATIFCIVEGALLNGFQWVAVVLAALAAMLFNWSGSGKTRLAGWLILAVNLVGYSMADILETNLVEQVKSYGVGDIRSAFATTVFVYTFLGLVALPFLPKLRITAGEFKMALPYAVLWLCSQGALFICFATVQPVFGNVILASRGLFSVIIGAILPFIGLAALDSKISRRKWIQRGVAALLMATAIGLYSYGKTLV